MAFAAITGGFTSQSSTANQASFTMTPDKTYAVGSFMVIIMALDNDGNAAAPNPITSITDNAGGNTWVVDYHVAVVAGTAQGGSHGVIASCQLATAIGTGTTITVNMTNATSRDKTAATCKGFSVAAGSTVSKQTQASAANVGGDPGGTNISGLTNQEWLFVGGYACETSDVTALTPSTNFTAITGTQTSGGGTAANQSVRAEYRIFTGTGSGTNPTYVSCDNVSLLVAYKEVAGSGTTQNLSGTTTSSSTVRHNVTNRKTATTTNTAVLRRNAAHSKFATTTSTADVISFRLFDQLLGAVLSSGAVIIKALTKPLQSSTASTGTLRRHVIETYSALTSSAAVIMKAVSHRKSASTSSSGGVSNARTYFQNLAGTTLSSAAIVVRDVTKYLAGLMTHAAGTAPSGSLRRDVAVRKTAVTSSSSIVVSVRAQFQNLTASTTSTGSLVRKGFKALAAALTPAAILRRNVTHRKTASTTSAGVSANLRTQLQNLFASTSSSGAVSFLYQLAQLLSASTSSSTALRRNVTHRKTANLASAANVAKDVSHRKTASTSSSGVFTFQGVITLFVAGVTASTGSLKRNASRVYAAVVASTSSVNRLVTHIKSGTITSAGDAGGSAISTLYASGTTTSTSSLARRVDHFIASQTSSSSTLSRIIGHRLASAVASFAEVVMQLVAPITPGTVEVALLSATMDVSESVVGRIGYSEDESDIDVLEIAADSTSIDEVEKTEIIITEGPIL